MGRFALFAVEEVCCVPVSANFPDKRENTGKNTPSPPVSALLYRQFAVLIPNFRDLGTVSEIRNRELTGNSSLPVEPFFVIKDRWRAGYGRVQPAG